MKKIDWAGHRTGYLTVVREVGKKGKRIFWECLCDCGNLKSIPTSRFYNPSPNISCGCHRNDVNRSRTGSQAGNWKGGRHVGTDGYVQVYKPGHHRAKKNGYVREHIVVMEAKLGRLLKPEEQVHHLNNIKDDNRPENLELWSRSQPSGARVEDLLSWAKWILEEYECQN